MSQDVSSFYLRRANTYLSLVRMNTKYTNGPLNVLFVLIKCLFVIVKRSKQDQIARPQNDNCTCMVIHFSKLIILMDCVKVKKMGTVVNPFPVVVIIDLI